MNDYNIVDLMGLTEDLMLAHPEHPEISADAVEARVRAQLLPRPHRRSFVRAAVIAAAAVLAVGTTVLAVDYAVNQRQVFLFDSLEALSAAYLRDHPEDADTALDYSVPGDGPAVDIAGVEASILQYHDANNADGEVLLSRSVGQASDPYTEQVTVQYEDIWTGQGLITEHRYFGASLSDLLPAQNAVVLNLAPIEALGTADPDAQMITTRYTAEGDLTFLRMEGVYLTPENTGILVELELDFSFESDALYDLNQGYDFCETYVTPAGTQVLLSGLDHQSQLKLYTKNGYLQVSWTDASLRQLKALADALDFSGLVD